MKRRSFHSLDPGLLERPHVYKEYYTKTPTRATAWPKSQSSPIFFSDYLQASVPLGPGDHFESTLKPCLAYSSCACTISGSQNLALLLLSCRNDTIIVIPTPNLRILGLIWCGTTHFVLQSDMVIGNMNSFPWIFDAVSSEKSCLTSMFSF